MKKFLSTVIVLAALAAAAYRGYNNYIQTPSDIAETNTGDIGDIEDTTIDGTTDETTDTDTNVDLTDATNTQDAIENATGSIVDEEFKAKLEAQQNIVLSGDNVTEDDIKLIEDILKQITDGTETN